MSDQEQTVYELVGGEQFFTDLTADFYRHVEADPELRALYPEEDLGPAERRLRLFLMQYWGGPSTYNDERGHPRLRMRHFPYPIDSAMRNRWLSAMGAALRDRGLPPDLEETMWRYFTMAAVSMENVDEGDPLERTTVAELSDDESGR